MLLHYVFSECVKETLIILYKEKKLEKKLFFFGI